MSSAHRLILGLSLSIALASGPLAASESMIELTTRSGCFICHSIDSREGETKPLAPTWRAIAERYAGRKNAQDYLVTRVLNGTAYSEQNWSGRISMRFMPPNVNVNRVDAGAMVNFILHLDTEIAAGDRFRRHEAMMVLATTSGCLACHQVTTDGDSRHVPLAPSFEQVAARYRDTPRAADYLVPRILKGTAGGDPQWTEVNMEFMPPNVGLTEAHARQLAEWVLTLE